MKLYNLICINECLNVVSHKTFKTPEDAANQMEIEANNEYEALVDEYDDDTYVHCDINKDGYQAEVSCDNGEPQTYVWHILEITDATE
jgi:hypothetical protein